MADHLQIDYRQLRITVAHPRDQDGELLVRYLQRLGCQIELLWPPPDRWEGDAELVFCCIDAQTRTFCAALAEKGQADLIAIADPATPKVLQMLGEANAVALLMKPIEVSAILTNLIVARNNSRYQRRLQSKITKLEETLRSVRKVERAKAILMARRQIDESEAYAYLREQAMRKRVPIGVIASVVVETSEVLSEERD